MVHIWSRTTLNLRGSENAGGGRPAIRLIQGCNVTTFLEFAHNSCEELNFGKRRSTGNLPRAHKSCATTSGAREGLSSCLPLQCKLARGLLLYTYKIRVHGDAARC